MGLCLSCCLNSARRTREQPRGRSRNRTERARWQGGGRYHSQSHNFGGNEGETLMSQCPMPVQYLLGQKFADSCAATSTCSPESSASSVPTASKGELAKVAVAWRSPVPIGAEELQRKRSEFWETAPAYGGCPEVWQTLQNCVAIGDSDIETARAILACAGVTTPLGFLTEAYDHKGFRYSVPAFCLCDPVDGLASPLKNSSGGIEKVGLRSLDHNLPKHPLSVRLSMGTDITLHLPLCREFCIGHLRKAILEQEQVAGRIEFFWSGHGPLPPDTALCSLADFTSPDTPFLQAWSFPSCS